MPVSYVLYLLVLLIFIIIVKTPNTDNNLANKMTFSKTERQTYFL